MCVCLFCFWVSHSRGLRVCTISLFTLSVSLYIIVLHQEMMVATWIAVRTGIGLPKAKHPLIQQWGTLLRKVRVSEWMRGKQFAQQLLSNRFRVDKPYRRRSGTYKEDMCFQQHTRRTCTRVLLLIIVLSLLLKWTHPKLIIINGDDVISRMT